MDSRIKFQRVMPLLVKEEKNKNDYIPKVVSIGPYHHYKPELAPVEAFKPLAVDFFVSGGTENTDFYHRKVLEMIVEILDWYGTSTIFDHFTLEQFARLMLRDACFVIIYMEVCIPDTAQPDPWLKMLNMVEHLGLLNYTIVQRDLFLLENQIPLCVIELLINLRYEAAGPAIYEDLLHRYLNLSLTKEYGDRQKRALKMEMGKEPLHLLEAFHRLLISDFIKQNKNEYKTHTQTDIECGVGPTMTTSGKQCMILGLLRTLACKKAAKNPKKEKVIHSFRSATDLKAKGIHFKPGPTISLEDVEFKSHFFYATLQLPYLEVTIYTKAFFLNMVAYELSSSSSANCEVTSYINFMKSLLERPEDVKELREKKILYNKLGSDQEVLRVYKDINTYGADNSEVFGKLKDKIEAHYQSYTETWMAELIHTYFRTPWTIIAFLGAISLLALSAVQVQYAIHPN